MCPFCWHAWGWWLTRGDAELLASARQAASTASRGWLPPDASAVQREPQAEGCPETTPSDMLKRDTVHCLFRTGLDGCAECCCSPCATGGCDGCAGASLGSRACAWLSM